MRLVGAQRQSLTNTEPEKIEHKTKKCLFYKPVCDIKIRNTSEDTCFMEGDFASFSGSLEHIVEYLYNHISTHLFPIWLSCVQLGCTVPESVQTKVQSFTS